MRLADILIKGIGENLTRSEKEYLEKSLLRLDNIKTSDTIVSSYSGLRTVNVYTADNYFDSLYFNQLFTPAAIGLAEDNVLQYNATSEEWEPVLSLNNLTSIGIGGAAPATGLTVAVGNVGVTLGDLTMTNGALYLTNGFASIGGTLSVTGNVGIGQSATTNHLDVYANNTQTSVFTSYTNNSFIYIESGMDGLGEISAIYFRSGSGSRWSVQKSALDKFEIYGFADGQNILQITAGGDVDLTPVGMVNITKTGEQVRFRYDASNYLSLIVDTSGDALFSATGTKIQFQDALQSDDFIGETTGWRITDPGYADFRNIYADELRVKAFTTETTASLEGAIIVTPSNAVVAEAFTIPNTSATASLVVRDHEGFLDTAVFNDGDTVLLRVIDTSTGGLIVTNVYGTVATYVNSTPGNGKQSWTFTTTTAGYSSADVIQVGSVVLDYGVDGDGIWEATVLDAGNSPYSQVSTWTGTPSNKTVHTRSGNLFGITTVDEYGFWAGTGTTLNDSYAIVSDTNAKFHNIDVTVGTSVNTTGRLSSSGYVSAGAAAPTTFDSGTGFWAGVDGGAAKFFVGVGNGKRLRYDGTDLYLHADANNYIRTSSTSLLFYANGAQVIGFNTPAVGDVLLGSASGGNLMWDASATSLLLRNSTTTVMTFPTSGAAVINGTLSVSGAINVGDYVVLDPDGITIESDTTYKSQNAIKFTRPASPTLNAYWSVNENVTYLTGDFYLTADAFNKISQLTIVSDGGTLGSSISIHSIGGDGGIHGSAVRLNTSGTTSYIWLDAEDYVQSEAPIYIYNSGSGNYYPQLSSVTGATNGALRITTESGYVQIGPQNTSWSHFYTDREKFYFDEGAFFLGGLVAGGSATTAVTPTDYSIRLYYSTTLMGEFSAQDTTWTRINQNVVKNIYTPRSFAAAGSLTSGTSILPGTGDVLYTGQLVSYKSSTQFPVYGTTFIAAQENFANYSTATKSTQAKTLVDMSVECPTNWNANIIAYYIAVAVKDSGSVGTDCYILCWDDTTANEGVWFGAGDINDRWNRGAIIVKAGTNADFYLQTIASGASTMDLYFRLLGYWI